jgi:hypothetical protein
VLALTHLDGTRELVVVGIPGDRDVDDKRAEAFAPAEVEPATADDFEKNPLLVKGYIGPWSPEGAILGEESATGIRYLLDPRVADGTAGSPAPTSTRSTRTRSSRAATSPTASSRSRPCARATRRPTDRAR